MRVFTFTPKGRFLLLFITGCCGDSAAFWDERQKLIGWFAIEVGLSDCTPLTQHHMCARQQIPTHEKQINACTELTSVRDWRRMKVIVYVWHRHTPENELEHKVFTVEGEQSLEETERDHAQLQSDRGTESYNILPPCHKTTWRHWSAMQKTDTEFLPQWKRKPDRSVKLPRGRNLPVSCCWCVWAVYRGLCRCHDDAAVWNEEKSWEELSLRHYVKISPDMLYLLSFHPQMTRFQGWTERKK